MNTNLGFLNARDTVVDQKAPTNMDTKNTRMTMLGVSLATY